MYFCPKITEYHSKNFSWLQVDNTNVAYLVLLVVLQLKIRITRKPWKALSVQEIPYYDIFKKKPARR